MPDRTFQCPNCGSPLTTTGAEKEVKCPYCGSTVIVPEGLRDKPQPAPAAYSYTPRQPSQDIGSSDSVITTSGFSAGRLGLVIGITVACAVAGAALAVFIPSRRSPVVQPADLAQSTTDAALGVAQNAINTANALVSTAVASPAPTPTQVIPTPVPFTTVLFQDDFSSSSSGWPRARNSKYTLEYKGGTYHVLINEQGQGQEVTSASEKDYADTSIAVDIQQTAGPNDGLMGVTCRNDGNGNFYSFEFSQDGTFGIYKYSKDSGDALDEESLQPNALNPQGVNHIEGICQGDTLTLLLNGQVLSQVQDSDFTKGEVGLIVRTGSSGNAGEDVLFSHLVVKGP